MPEKQLRLASTISQGDWWVFVKQPISAGLLLATAAVLLVPALLDAAAFTFARTTEPAREVALINALPM